MVSSRISRRCRWLFGIYTLILGSCITPDHTIGDLLTPDAFHVYYSDGEASSFGTSGPVRDPDRIISQAKEDFQSWTAGFSWDLIGPSPKQRLRDEAQKRAEAMLLKINQDILKILEILDKETIDELER